MINYSLEPNENNIKETLIKDKLNRNKWISKLLRFILDMSNSIIAIDGKWGSGKTFVAKQMIEIINEKLNMLNNEDNSSYLKEALNLNFVQIQTTSSFAIYYNAWEYDNDNDPMKSFLYYLLIYLNRQFKSSRFNGIIRNLLLNLVDKISNGFIKIQKDDSPSEIEEAIQEVLTSEFIKEQINILFQELKSEKCNKLVIFVDELDRCRPIYALRFMELLNQYFRRDDILIICTLDLSQLSNVIETYYGTTKNSYLFIDKIVDFRFEIPENNIDYEVYINYKTGGSFNKMYLCNHIFLELINEEKLSLRNIDRLLIYLTNIFSKNISREIDDNLSIFIKQVIVPYILVMKLYNYDSYLDFFNKNFTKIIRFLKEERIKDRLDYFYRNDSNIKDYKSEKYEAYIEHDLDIIVDYISKRINSLDSVYMGKAYLDIREIFNNIDLLSYLK